MSTYLGSYGEPDDFGVDVVHRSRGHSENSSHSSARIERRERRKQRHIERQVSETSGLYTGILEELALYRHHFFGHKFA